MWQTNSGPRMLVDAEAKLFRRIVQQMAENLDPSSSNAPYDTETSDESGIHWYDQWESNQQLWLLEQVSLAFFTNSKPPSPVAMLDATVDAMMHQLICNINDEMSDPHGPQQSWRRMAIEAHAAQIRPRPTGDWTQFDMNQWTQVTAKIADEILGPTSYQAAEPFRDQDPANVAKYLQLRGLPEDYLSTIPPMRTNDQANDSHARIQSIIQSP